MKKFEVGDAVYCERYGHGEVFEILDFYEYNYPVIVKFLSLIHI